MSWTPGFSVPIPNEDGEGSQDGTTKAEIGLGNVDNTSDLNKPVSTAQQDALDLKADTADLPTHTGGLLSARPSATGMIDGSTYFATDDDGGTLYQVRSEAWSQVAPGTTEASGIELARTELSASPSVIATTTLTDVSGLSITFATTTKPAIIHAVFPQCSNSIANSGGRVALHDGTAVIDDAAGDGGAAASLFQLRIEHKIPAATASKTYKIQYAHRTSGNFTIGASSFRLIKLYAVTC